jgi:N-acetylneuraminic acid mutarotase
LNAQLFKNIILDQNISPMKKYYHTLCFLFLSFLSSAQYSWTVKDSFPGTPRRMAAGLIINNSVGYLVGGNSALPATFLNDVWEYIPSTGNWSQKANFPYMVCSPAYFAINDVGYVVGGTQSAGVYVSTNEAYNSANDTWSAKASFPENGVSEAFQFVINGLAYVGAGARNGSGVSSTMYAYNPTADSWATMASYPGPQSINMAGFAIDSFGYAGIGQNGAGSFFNQFYKYNPANNSWTQIASFPGKVRCAATCFVLNGKAYVGGGVTTVSGTSSAYDLGDFYEYDPGTNAWSAVPGFPGAPRQYATPFVFGDIAYTVCGFNDDGGLFYNMVNKFGTCSTISAVTPIPGGNSNARMKIYPNPSTNEVTVKISDPVTSEVKYEVVSVDGKVVKTGSTTQSTFGFNANNFANGVYILNITDGNGTHGAERFEVMH